MDLAAVTRRIWELAEPLALSAGLDLIDVQFRPEGGRMLLRLLLDHPDGPRPGQGVTLDELSRYSRELGDVLDGHDVIAGRYHLECSSPGLNRPLVREAHFRRAIGERVSVRTRAPVGDRRQFHGVLERIDAAAVVVADPAVGSVTIPLAEIEKAHVEFEFARPAGAPPAHARGHGG